VLYDAGSGQEVCRWRAGAVAVRAVTFSPDGRTLATGGDWGSAVRLWDVRGSLAARSGKEVCPSAGHTAPVDLLAISRDGKTLLSSGRDRQVLRWDVAAGTPHLAVTLPAGTEFAAKGLSADVRLLALGEGKSGSVSLWDVRAGKQLRLL